MNTAGFPAGSTQTFTTRASLVVDTLADPGTPGDGFSSLRQAIADAQSGGSITFASALGGGTINLLTNGQITVANSLIIDASALTNGIAIDGNASSRIFAFESGTTNMLDSLVLTNGLADNGGAIYANSGAVLALSNSTLSGNVATNNGGGLFNAGTLTIDNSSLSGNTAVRSGGAIVSTGAGVLMLNQSTLSGNTSGYRGGGLFNAGTLDVNNCTFEQNQASSWGGGLIHANTTKEGGVYRSTFPGNYGSNGGGIFNNNSTLTLVHVTISSNSANNSGGLYNGSGTINCTNSIVAGNSATSDDNIRNVSGTLNTNACLTSGDPDLAPLGDYAGPTHTMPPLPGSAAIDAGAITALTTDQRGFASVGTPDIGAAEYQEASDLALFWLEDWDADGNAFGLEHALGTDSLVTDAANKANLAVLQSSGTVSVTFGFNPAASNTTAWVVKRSLDLLPGSFLEVYRYDGPTDTTTTNIPISVNMTSSSFEVQDLSSPQPTSAFYSLEAELSP